LDTRLTVALPLKLPAAPVFSATPSALLEAPAARPVIVPEPPNPAATAPKPAFSRSVNASGDAFVTVSAVCGAASPTRAASATCGGATVGLARRYTAPLTATVCADSGVTPRPLVPVPSDASVIV